MTSRSRRSALKTAPPSEERPASRRSPAKILTALCLLAGFVAAVYAFREWREASRPGMVHYLHGMDYADAHRYGEARDEWLRGVREDPSSSPCWVQLGAFYAQTGQNAKAARCYGAAAQLLPNDGSVFLKQAQAEEAQGHSRAALAPAQRAAALLPDSADAQALYGSLAGDQNDRPAAFAALRRAFALRPLDRGIALALAYMDVRSSGVADARLHLLPYLQAHPEDGEANYLMALILLQQPPAPPTLQEALTDAQRAQTALPRDPRAYGVLSQAYLGLHRPQDALRTDLDGMRVDPHSTEILNGLVVAYAQLGNAKGAADAAVRLERESRLKNQISHLTTIANLNPADVTPALRLARLEEEDGQTGQALKDYEHALTLAPHDPRPRLALAAFLRRAGRPDLVH